MKRLLLTGGAGFIGSHTVSYFLEHTDWEIVVMDRLSYAGNLNFLTDDIHYQQHSDRVRFIYHDFRSPISETTRNLIGYPYYIIHMGAESHVDRSITDPYPFAYSNVIGTLNMLEYAKEEEPEKFIYISTDEVYGPSIDGHLHVEGEPHRPSNPYSASKSGAEAFCYAYWNTHNVPVIITNTMNNYGERQNNEKFVMKTIKRLLDGEEMIAHCKMIDDKVVDVSSRCWLHAKNHADGIMFLLEHGIVGERYNLVGEWAAVDTVIKMIASYLGVEPKIVYEDFHTFRPGHDMHYGLDGTKMKEMGWIPPLSFAESLKRVVDWTRNNQKWL